MPSASCARVPCGGTHLRLASARLLLGLNKDHSFISPGAATAGSAGVCMTEQKKGSYLES